MSLTPCMHCGRLTKNARCERHTRRQDKERLNSEPWRGLYGLASWKEVSRMVKRRDGNRCTNCGGTDLLQAHHTIPLHQLWQESSSFLDFATRATEPELLITLCAKCHSREERNQSI